MMKRCQWRGIDAETIEFTLEDKIDFTKLDIVLLGGGSDREQMLVCDRLRTIQKDFHDYVEDGGSVIAVCGGYQLLGHYYDTDEGRIEGLSLVDLDSVYLIMYVLIVHFECDYLLVDNIYLTFSTLFCKPVLMNLVFR